MLYRLGVAAVSWSLALARDDIWSRAKSLNIQLILLAPIATVRYDKKIQMKKKQVFYGSLLGEISAQIWSCCSRRDLRISLADVMTCRRRS